MTKWVYMIISSNGDRVSDLFEDKADAIAYKDSVPSWNPHLWSRPIVPPTPKITLKDIEVGKLFQLNKTATVLQKTDHVDAFSNRFCVSPKNGETFHISENQEVVRV